MKNILIAATALALLVTGTAGAFAQPHRDDRHDDHRPAPAMHAPPRHDWRQGGHIERTDWNRGQRVDYRHYHLRTPPRGYEWRQVDGNFVLAAAATGLIASIMLASH